MSRVVIFLLPAFIFIASMRYRRGRPKGVPLLILYIAGIYDRRHMVVIQS